MQAVNHLPFSPHGLPASPLADGAPVVAIIPRRQLNYCHMETKRERTVCRLGLKRVNGGEVRISHDQQMAFLVELQSSHRAQKKV